MAKRREKFRNFYVNSAEKDCFFQPSSYWNFIKKHFFKLFTSELGQI
jgi:hypothetical protein